LTCYFFLLIVWLPPRYTLFPYTTLFRSAVVGAGLMGHGIAQAFAVAGHEVMITDKMMASLASVPERILANLRELGDEDALRHARSEEHTSELQSRENLVCRLLLEKKKTQ